jgi:predicted ATP-grasp superfamily ATP-dependent carboligase
MMVDPLADTLPPAIVFHGGNNATSIARSLQEMGVQVYALNKRDAAIRWSRAARWIELPPELDFQTAAAQFLTGPASESLRGSVLLAASDEALEVLLEHREVLAERFLLDACRPGPQRVLLDKLATYEAARRAGIPTPRFCALHGAAELEELRVELVFPLLVKPRLSHLFQHTFGQKFMVVEDFDALSEVLGLVAQADIEVLLVEKITGPDSRLCSYFTYIDEQGEPAFDFTKRILRRYPKNHGLGTYHITDRVDGVRELSLALLREVGLVGLANVEFMLDERDGELKLIECNARFVGIHGLLTAAGLDLARFVYRLIVGLPSATLLREEYGLHWWDPWRDFVAYRELRGLGEITLARWVVGLLRWQVLPIFSWRDPLPSLATTLRKLRKLAP